MLKKALMLVSSNAFGSALLLVRNLIVARLISPEDYGIASTFAISMSIVEMMTYLGLNQMIVIDKRGDEPRVQAAMQGFQVLRGIATSSLLFLIAHPYARFLGVEDVAWAYQVIAFIPFLNGFQHFDMHRLKRHMNFTPSILANAVPALVSVLALWPVALIFDDYRIMLVALFVQAASMVLVSHLTAARPYRLAFDYALMRRATAFGWPLLLNGMLLFGVFNGERLIVGRELGMSQLAVFSMAFTLTLTPTLVLASSSQSFFLPQLSGKREDAAGFERLGIVTMESSLVIAVLLVLGASLVGGPLAMLLLGHKYDAILAILVPITVLQALRVSKTGSAVVALSKGLSGNAVLSNSFRVLSLPISWWVAIHTGDMLSIIWIGCLAELLGYLAAIWLAAKRTGMRIRRIALPAALTGVTLICALYVALRYPAQANLWAHLQSWHWLVIAVALAALASMSGIRGYLWQRLRRRHGR